MIPLAELRAARILIVDDTEANVLLLEAMLRGTGYTAVSRTLDPRQVCKLHREHRYDLILLDLNMPEMDGFAVMEKLREIEPEGYLPVLVLTAQPGLKLRALRAGARDFVSKPFDLAEVLMRVQNLVEVQLLHKELVRSCEQLEVRNRLIRQTFGRYLSDDIVESLLASPEALELGGETRRVTMMMADLRGFTAISETLAPGKVVAMLNNYFEAMIEVTERYRGTINEFVGDGFLAIFGAPVSGADDARRAVECAVAMQLAMARVNDRNRELGLPVLEMGIGLNTGDVVVGNIGSARRAKYGVVGSAVNLTSRIESYTTGGQIMISQSTLEATEELTEVDERLQVEPKGFSQSIPIYSVAGIKGRPDLTLPRVEDRLLAPHLPVRVRFALIEGKDASGEIVEGSVLRLSPRGAEIAAPIAAPALANLKLQFLVDGAEGPGAEPVTDLYAKVRAGASPPGLFVVHFTSVPPPARRFLDGLFGIGSDASLDLVTLGG